MCSKSCKHSKKDTKPILSKNCAEFCRQVGDRLALELQARITSDLRTQSATPSEDTAAPPKASPIKGNSATGKNNVLKMR